MKHSLISLCSGLLLSLPLASAQNAPQPGIPGPAPQPALQPAIPGQPVPRPERPRIVPPDVVSPRQAVGLEENRTVRLEGGFGEKRGIKTTVTGLGPRFEADSQLEDGSQLSIRYDLSETDKGLQVSYSIGLQVEVKMGNNSQYRNLAFTGRVLCTEGKPVEIYANGTQKLSLSVETAKAEKPDVSK